MYNTPKIVKVGDSAETFALFDHYFWSLVVDYMGNEPNVKGAIDSEHWSVAFIAMKKLLHSAILIHLYLNGWYTYDRSIYYMYRRLKDSLADNPRLYDEIISIEYMNLDDIDAVKRCANRSIEIAYELVPAKYIEYYYADNKLNFDKHLETMVLIDELDKKRGPYRKLAFPPEINQKLLNLSRKIENKVP